MLWVPVATMLKPSAAVISKDEISVSLGVDPKFACDLADAISRNPSMAGAALPPPPRSEAAKPEGAGGPNPNPGENNKAEPPKKKPKAPRPEAGSGISLISSKPLKPVVCQGSELEVTVMQDTDLETFVTNWKNSCTTAEGKATTVKSSLSGSYM